MNKNAILKFVAPEKAKFLSDIQCFPSLPSTSDYLLNLAKNSASSPIIACLAETQTSGRGQRGNKWISPFGQNIYFSLLFHFKKNLSELKGLSIAVALAVANTVKLLGINTGIGLKWPNDLFYEKQKLSGVLIEVIERMVDKNMESAAVIGIGLNVNMTTATADSPPQISQDWTSLQDILGTILNRNEIVGLLLNELLETLPLFEKQGLSPFLKPWQTLDLAMNKKVILTTANTVLKGWGRGISDKGHFLLEPEESRGQIQSFPTAEVSIKIF